MVTECVVTFHFQMAFRPCSLRLSKGFTVIARSLSTPGRTRFCDITVQNFSLVQVTVVMMTFPDSRPRLIQASKAYLQKPHCTSEECTVTSVIYRTRPHELTLCRGTRLEIFDSMQMTKSYKQPSSSRSVYN